MVQQWWQLRELQVFRLELRYEGHGEHLVLQSLRAINVEEFATKVCEMLPSLKYCHLRLDEHLPTDTAWRTVRVRSSLKRHDGTTRVLEQLDDERSRRLCERPIEESFKDI